MGPPHDAFARRGIGLRDRLIVAFTACLATLVVDLKSTATLVAAILYTPVVALFHKVRRPSVSPASHWS